MFAAANQNIGRKADGLQFLHTMLRGLGLQLPARRQIGQQRQMHQDRLATGPFVNKLPDRLEKRQALDIAHRAANLAQHEIHLLIANAQEVFDFIRHMRNDLNGLAKVIPAPFLPCSKGDIVPGSTFR